MRTYRKDVSDEEVRSCMVQHINELLRHVRPRVVVELKQESVKVAGAAGGAGPKRSSGDGGAKGFVTSEERELIVDVFECPDLGVTRRSSRLGLSAYRMNALKSGVVRKGYLEQFSVNLGREFGGKVSLLGLTDAGYRFLGKEPVVRPENVSLEHWWWQQKIRDFFVGKGFEAVVEKARGGKRADVGVVKGGEDVAVEVELSPKNALSNITVDLDVGFDRVVCCCKDKMVAREVRRRLREHKRYGLIKDLVEVKVLTELELVKDLFSK